VNSESPFANSDIDIFLARMCPWPLLKVASWARDDEQARLPKVIGDW
jgi:hypothetical protein